MWYIANEYFSSISSGLRRALALLIYYHFFSLKDPNSVAQLKILLNKMAAPMIFFQQLLETNVVL